MIFFEGTLQEGISAALQQAKSVVCFVTDGGDESQQWENDYFAEEEIRSRLEAQAVSLRLEAGSQEEGFLAQLYPIPKKPTVVVIKSGQLREYIAAPVPKNDFIRRIKTVLDPTPPATSEPATAPDASQPAPAATTAPTTQAAPVSESPASSNPPNHEPEPSATSPPTNAAAPGSTNAHVLAILAERAARLAEKKKQEEEEAKRQRAEKAKAKAEAEAKGQPPDEQSKHAAAIRKRQQEARQERERILKAIEDDKAARRARREQEAAARRAGTPGEHDDEKKPTPESAPFAPASQVFPPLHATNPHPRCAIQVRLLDGSTIRERFSSDETLADVRRWVDETRKDDAEKRTPYAFKVLLTPLPSRTIDVTEESKTLRELDLVPSSTLILLRVPKHAAAAYAAGATGAVVAGGGNILQRVLALATAVFTGFFGSIAAFFSTLFSTSGPPAAAATAEGRSAAGQTTQSQAPAEGEARRRAGGGVGGGGRVVGLGDLNRGQDDQQDYYNGNSTNFMSRPDDGE
ncbi:hypothetical protein VTJ83DRAFT_1730 [Remersonia thermophila]|uniref:UBX domain-containing protein 2 n=1 Tax=Remersonia thermophila TaxID=72144 RepID=A0ABR4DH02_9PEZI